MLDRFRAALSAGRTDIRLLVPTATLVEHLRHQCAREGLIFRPELIQTLSRYAASLAGAGVRLVSRPLFYVIVEDTLRRVAPAEFARVSDAPGFPASLAQAIEMLDAAGCGAAELAHLREEAPLAPALGLVWKEVDAALRARGLVTRTGLLRHAAEAAREGHVREVWCEGFAAFSDPELALVRALGSTPILSRDREGAVAPIRFAADSIEREVEEIARRILASGREFRDIGVALRNPEQYAGLIEAVFERFGIPARFYFGADLTANPAAAYLIATVDALLSGWEHEPCLAALRLAPRLGVSAIMDRFDFEVRKQLPNRGLAALQTLTHHEWLADAFTEWQRLDAWRNRKLAPTAWAEKLSALRALFTPGKISERQPWDRVAMYRSQAMALDLFESAMDEAAAWWNGAAAPVSLDDFWRIARAILRMTTLRVTDDRRNVVHVMSVYEARQWDLNTLFLCGLAEKQFPRRHPQNSFVPDLGIRRLQQSGRRVPSSDDLNAEEAPLFAAVAARAREQLVLSYAREEQNLPSVFYSAAGAEEEPCVPVRPVGQPLKYRPASAIVSADLLPVLKERSMRPNVTGLETYLQCPFKFFARTILKLEPAPVRPEDRISPLEQGSLVHQVLADWYRERPPIGPLFDARYREKCDKLRVPAGYRSEVLRAQMRIALERFAADEMWPRGNSAAMELKIEFDLGDGITIGGRIDRLETLPDGSVAIVDYKYSSAVNTRKKVEDETLLQGPLYVAALRGAYQVSAMVYYNVRTDPNNQAPKVYGWGAVSGLGVDFKELNDAWVDQGIASAGRVVAEFRSGRVLPHPADSGNCRYCDFQDACRWESTAAGSAANAAGN
jgi:RecB family exonuclease